MTDAAPDILQLHAQATPDKPALVEDQRVVDFAELDRWANQIASVLLGEGARGGVKVVWCGANAIEVPAITHAIRRTGATAVPLNYRLSADEAAYVIDNCDAEIVLFDGDQIAQLTPVATESRCPTVRRWLAYRIPADSVPRWAGDLTLATAVESTDPVEPVGETGPDGETMIYTSGTTGLPKGAVRPPPDPAAVGALLQLIGYTADDVYLTTGPLYHSGPGGFIALAATLGNTAVIQRRFDAEAWLALVAEHGVTTTFSAPTPIRRVVDLPAETRAAYDYSSMQRLIGNAAPWPFDLKRRYVEAFGDTSLFEVYGSTELGVDTVLLPADQMRKPGSCGRAAPTVDIALFDDAGEPVTEPMVPGELYVRSTLNFSGYHKARDKFEESRRGDWLTVGDIAYVDDEGYYFICDRKNDMIISGGMNIYPAEIEAVLVAHPAVEDAAVFGVPDDEWGEAVHAVISTYHDQPVTDDEITRLARDHLASYKVPRSYERVDEIPRSASGKTLKKDLRAPFWADAAT